MRRGWLFSGVFLLAALGTAHAQPSQSTKDEALNLFNEARGLMAEGKFREACPKLERAEAIDPGSTAAVLIWENLWAIPFAVAARHAGGQLVASGRIPIQALVAAIEADEED